MTQRTSTAVSKWLQKQEWYESYVETLGRYSEYDGEYMDKFLSGHMMEETVHLAFPWYLSPDGVDFWIDIDKQFKEWFYGEN